jgi:hypothetical protein
MHLEHSLVHYQILKANLQQLTVTRQLVEMDVREALEKSARQHRQVDFRGRAPILEGLRFSKGSDSRRAPILEGLRFSKRHRRKSARAAADPNSKVHSLQ